VLDAVRETLSGEDAWVVGGAVRDELLGRPLVDLDVACREPERAAKSYADGAGGAVFALSERHGAWRVARRDGRTVDFTPLPSKGIEADLATRDFTVNAIARPLGGGEEVDPFGGVEDLRERRVRVVSPTVFEDDPLRLLRAVRFEQELGFRMDDETERLVREHAGLVTRPAGERILDELSRLEPPSFQRLEELGLLEPLGGSLDQLDQLDRLEQPSNSLLLVAVFGDALNRLPISRELARYARTLLHAELPPDLDARSVHRFRRATEPWALDVVAFLSGSDELSRAVAKARAEEPDEPLVRGDELGLPPGPTIGRILERIEEERAAGTISTREEALELARREAQ
jgi:Poly A polymerase head domain/Probable RNA and SrmB- binding site of polymerase A